MAAIGKATIKVHVVMDVNGQPVKVLHDAPNAATLHDQPGGLEVTIHLDAEQLARAIMPYLIRDIRHSVGVPPLPKEKEKQQE